MKPGQALAVGAAICDLCALLDAYFVSKYSEVAHAAGVVLIVGPAPSVLGAVHCFATNHLHLFGQQQVTRVEAMVLWFLQCVPHCWSSALLDHTTSLTRGYLANVPPCERVYVACASLWANRGGAALQILFRGAGSGARYVGRVTRARLQEVATAKKLGCRCPAQGPALSVANIPFGGSGATALDRFSAFMQKVEHISTSEATPRGQCHRVFQELAGGIYPPRRSAVLILMIGRLVGVDFDKSEWLQYVAVGYGAKATFSGRQLAADALRWGAHFSCTCVHSNFHQVAAAGRCRALPLDQVEHLACELRKLAGVSRRKAFRAEMQRHPSHTAAERFSLWRTRYCGRTRAEHTQLMQLLAAQELLPLSQPNSKPLA